MIIAYGAFENGGKLLDVWESASSIVVDSDVNITCNCVGLCKVKSHVFVAPITPEIYHYFMELGENSNYYMMPSGQYAFKD